jgi:hypothetical protein
MIWFVEAVIPGVKQIPRRCKGVGYWIIHGRERYPVKQEYRYEHHPEAFKDIASERLEIRFTLA